LRRISTQNSKPGALVSLVDATLIGVVASTLKNVEENRPNYHYFSNSSVPGSIAYLSVAAFD
jgi:hypothetical protein